MIQSFPEISWSKRVGTKAVNALSNYFRVESVRDEKQKRPNSPQEIWFSKKKL
jgi:hypothetical protein